MGININITAGIFEIINKIASPKEKTFHESAYKCFHNYIVYNLYIQNEIHTINDYTPYTIKSLEFDVSPEFIINALDYLFINKPSKYKTVGKVSIELKNKNIPPIKKKVRLTYTREEYNKKLDNFLEKINYEMGACIPQREVMEQVIKHNTPNEDVWFLLEEGVEKKFLIYENGLGLYEDSYCYEDLYEGPL